MSDPANIITSLTQRLAEVQRRLADVELERSALQREAQTLQEQLAVVLPQPYGATNRSQVLSILRRNPQLAYSPLDLCGTMGRSYRDVNAIRLLLGRLLRDGLVKRIAHGRYQIN